MRELVFRAEHDRRADDRRVGEGAAHGLLPFALRAGVNRLAFCVRADRRDMDEGLGSAVASGFGDVARALHMDSVHVLERTREVDHRACPLDGPADALPVRSLGADEPELADLAQRLDVVGVARLASDDPRPRLGLEQSFADVAADEAAAAEHGYELGFSHWAATSGWRGALTTRRLRQNGLPRGQAAAFFASEIVGQNESDGLAVGLGDPDLRPDRLPGPARPLGRVDPRADPLAANLDQLVALLEAGLLGRAARRHVKDVQMIALQHEKHACPVLVEDGH